MIFFFSFLFVFLSYWLYFLSLRHLSQNTLSPVWSWWSMLEFSHERVKGLVCPFYCLLTLQVLEYWEAVPRMTTVVANLITVRHPVWYPGFFLDISVDFYVCVSLPIVVHLPLHSSCRLAVVNAKQSSFYKILFLFLTVPWWFLTKWSCWFMSWITWMQLPLFGEETKSCLVWRVGEGWENLFLYPANSVASPTSAVYFKIY